MFRILFPLLLSLILVGCGGGEELSLVCWNVENLFDPVDCPQTNDRVLTPEAYESRLKGIAGQLKSLNADLIALSEVENISVLAELARRSGYPYYYLEEGNDPRGIDVALLSRLPLNYESNSHLPTPYKGNKKAIFSRDCAVAVIPFAGKRLYLLNTHLKSMRGGIEETEPIRLAESKGILDIIEGIYRKEEAPLIILTGDLNCHRYSTPLNLLEKSGLTILNYSRPQSGFYTNKYRGKRGDLDYIIFNRELKERVKVRKFYTVNSPEIEELSDHYPLYLMLEL